MRLELGRRMIAGVMDWKGGKEKEDRERGKMENGEQR